MSDLARGLLAGLGAGLKDVGNSMIKREAEAVEELRRRSLLEAQHTFTSNENEKDRTHRSGLQSEQLQHSSRLASEQHINRLDEAEFDHELKTQRENDEREYQAGVAKKQAESKASEKLTEKQEKEWQDLTKRHDDLLKEMASLQSTVEVETIDPNTNLPTKEHRQKGNAKTIEEYKTLLNQVKSRMKAIDPERYDSYTGEITKDKKLSEAWQKAAKAYDMSVGELQGLRTKVFTEAEINQIVNNYGKDPKFDKALADPVFGNPDAYAKVQELLRRNEGLIESRKKKEAWKQKEMETNPYATGLIQ